jgi:hypothetical protein
VPTYDLGDGVPLEHEVRDADDVLTNATVTLALTRPDGTTFTPAPLVTNPSTGIYRSTPVPDMVGLSWTGAWASSGAVISVKPFSFSVADPAPPGYVELPLVKSALGKMTADDRDDLILQAIAAASRWIEGRCGRRFYPDRAATARTFPVVGQSLYDACDQVLLVDDIASADDLAVSTGSTGSWTPVTGWDTGPDNAFAVGLPVTQLRSRRGWLPLSGRVQVTARWGWPAVPDDIAQAALLQATRLYRRKDSPQGVLGNSEWGPTRVSRSDPDVEALIAPYVIFAIA